MSAEDSPDGDRGEYTETGGDTGPTDTGGPVDLDSEEVRQRLEEGADRAVEQFDEGIVDLLSWILDTETRARIYIQLRQEPHGTSDEIAEGTGLYPSTVREALAALHEEGTVTRQKRQNDGAGNNPYEYSAIPPSELVGDIAEEVQSQLNTVFNLDDYIDRTEETGSEPVTITVRDGHDSDGAGGDGHDSDGAGGDGHDSDGAGDNLHDSSDS